MMELFLLEVMTNLKLSPVFAEILGKESGITL